jgi:hypothetical protein
MLTPSFTGCDPYRKFRNASSFLDQLSPLVQSRSVLDGNFIPVDDAVATSLPLSKSFKGVHISVRWHRDPHRRLAGKLRPL